MRIALYKPNKSNTGHALSFKSSVYNKSVSLMLEMVKQSGWDDVNKTGSFKANAKDPAKKVAVKFSTIEVGGLIGALRKGTPFKAFHKSESGQTSISLSLYDKKVPEGKAPEKAFSLSVMKGDNKFGASIELAESEALLIFFTTFLTNLFNTAEETQIESTEPAAE